MITGFSHVIVLSLWPIYSQAYLVQIIVYFSDFTIIPAIIMYIFKKVVFLFKLLPLVCYAWQLHVKEITRKTFRQQKKFDSAKEKEDKRLFKRKLNLNGNKIWTSFFIREHTKLLVDLIHFNRHFASVLIIGYYLPVLFASVFVLCFLYFFQVLYIIRIYYTVFYVIIIFTYAFLVSLSAVIKVLYKNGAVSELCRAQIRMESSAKGKCGAFLRNT